MLIGLAALTHGDQLQASVSFLVMHWFPGHPRGS
jgi:hypothetical protein